MRIVAWLVLFSFVPSTIYAASLSAGEASAGREFMMSNRDNRLLVRIQLWGDVANSGIYFVPDNATLLDALGSAGGPSGIFSKTSILVTRLAGKDKPAREFELDGKDLVTNPTYRNMTLNNGDVIFVDAPQKVDTFGRTLSIVGAILSIISTSLTIYLVVRK